MSLQGSNLFIQSPVEFSVLSRLKRSMSHLNHLLSGSTKLGCLNGQWGDAETRISYLTLGFERRQILGILDRW